MPDKPLTIPEHLEELRKRLLRVIFAVLILSVVGFIYARDIVDELILAPLNAEFPTYRFLCGLGLTLFCELNPGSFQLINTSLPAQFTLHLKVAFLTGLVLSVPYLFLEMWWYVKPALKPEEKRVISSVWWLLILLVFAGLLFAYFVLIPFSIRFLYTYQLSSSIVNLISIQSYMSTFLTLMTACILIFLLPVVLLVLVKLNLIDGRVLVKARPYIIVLAFVLGAILTPPDVISQIMLAIPLYLLFEFSVFLVRLVGTRQD